MKYPAHHLPSSVICILHAPEMHSQQITSHAPQLIQTLHDKGSMSGVGQATREAVKVMLAAVAATGEAAEKVDATLAELQQLQVIYEFKTCS